MRGGSAFPAPVWRRELRYGSREFLAASELARSLPLSPPVSALAGSVVRDPARRGRRAQAVLELPAAEECYLAGRHPGPEYGEWSEAACSATSAGNQYFQHLLGCGGRNLHVGIAESGD